MNIRNLEIESQIYNLCSPYIAKKVILEYCRAKEEKYIVHQKTAYYIMFYIKTLKTQKQRKEL